MNIGLIYALYVAISLAMTAWVARTLHRNGRVFLVDAFRGNEILADAVNHLLVVGFYLVNIGFILLALKTEYSMANLRAVLEVESWKLGVVVTVLGIMHVTNIVILTLMRFGTRNRANRETELPATA
ncbi:hypothetical protein SAMN05421819_1947 [Bryocella elongata]|uniref:Uncharacterized protein n=1 Tax=Bryocella elongata TaxID=863522 RepID=A0A1H5XTH6_9BACT|nr:hypothetical protein [Bryocella elongata]SEG14566.1 hypothetical protein SAMN05421819_1947 [Bryocella elongata]